jgi:hypothetical protein
LSIFDTECLHFLPTGNGIKTNAPSASRGLKF